MRGLQPGSQVMLVLLCMSVAVATCREVPSQVVPSQVVPSQEIIRRVNASELPDDLKVKVLARLEPIFGKLKNFMNPSESRRAELMQFVDESLVKLSTASKGNSPTQTDTAFSHLLEGVKFYLTSPEYTLNDPDDVVSQIDRIAGHMVDSSPPESAFGAFDDTPTKEEIKRLVREYLIGIAKNTAVPQLKSVLPADALETTLKEVETAISKKSFPHFLNEADWSKKTDQEKKSYLRDPGNLVAQDVFTQLMPILNEVVRQFPEGSAALVPVPEMAEEGKEDFNKLWSEMLQAQRERAKKADEEWERETAAASKMVQEVNQLAQRVETAKPIDKSFRWVLVLGNIIGLIFVGFILLRKKYLTSRNAGK